MEKIETFETLSKLELGSVVGAQSSTQTSHSHATYGIGYYATGIADTENCGDSYADECCE